ncbi:innexin-3-like, partial [Symsagittifera roscoffensis]|uniref:innexin-3-like n=1 Tax=Symsagittifera roscoffensis TaxID=84072 RepID=UPI00307B338E
MLVAQALMFFAPSLIWRAVSSQNLDMGNIVEATTLSDAAIRPSERDEVVKNIALQMDRFLKNRRYYKLEELRFMGRILKSKVFCFVVGSRYGNILGPVYLITKVFYLMNVYGQLFILDSFLGPKYHAYGVEVITSVFNGQDWTNSRRFPTITLCDFPVRSLGNLQRYTVQCVLSINLFNERIYLCIWFMLLSVAIVTSLNTVMWAWRLCLRFNRIKYIMKHLKLTATISGDSNTEKRLVGQFVDQYLRHDGAFIFKLLAQNTNSLIISELITEVWKTFLRTLKKECRRYKCSEHAPLTTQSLKQLNSWLVCDHEPNNSFPPNLNSFTSNNQTFMAFPTPPTLQKHTNVMELALPGNNSHLHMWKMENELKTEDTEDYDDGENDPLTSNDQATEEKCAHE